MCLVEGGLNLAATVLGLTIGLTALGHQVNAKTRFLDKKSKGRSLHYIKTCNKNTFYGGRPV